jgi:hypothetical protein
MSYHEDRQGKLKRQTSKQAISLAMEGRWQESIVVNKDIIEHFPNDVDAHNRLGKAYLELGEYELARESYEKALSLDRFNTIARKNLERLDHLIQSTPAQPHNTEKAAPNLFIEEIGKAGAVNLYQIAGSERLIRMTPGDKVYLKPQDTSLAVENSQGEYLGLVPSKQGQRLIRLMKGGNEYTAAVIASDGNSISIIIRETFQSSSQIGQISFPARRLEEIQPYISDRVYRPELEEEEEVAETAAFTEEGIEVAEDAVESMEEDKEWEQEA